MDNEEVRQNNFTIYCGNLDRPIYNMTDVGLDFNFFFFSEISIFNTDSVGLDQNVAFDLVWH